MALLPDHPHLNILKNQQLWTVSDKNKRPIDAVALIAGKGIFGAKTHDEKTLVTCKQLDDAFPTIANHALWIDSDILGFVVIDIESYASEDIKKSFIALAHEKSWYVETSLSGHGVHVLAPLPSNAREYPYAFAKPSLKSTEGFEILINHFCTFTGNIIPSDDTVSHDCVLEGYDTLEKVWQNLAQDTKASPQIQLDFSAISDREPDYGNSKDLLLAALSSGNQYAKTVEDFDGDNSKYEFGVIGFYTKKLFRMIRLDDFRTQGIDWDQEHLSWLVWTTIKNVIEEREKHFSLRNGVPYLLHQVHVMVCREMEYQRKIDEEKKANDPLHQLLNKVEPSQ